MPETYRCGSCWVVFDSEGEVECPSCGEENLVEIHRSTLSWDDRDDRED